MTCDGLELELHPALRRLIGVLDALFWGMKAIAMVLLVGLAVAYYFGYDPSDLIPSIPTNNPPSHRARHAAGPAEATQNATPTQSNTSNVVAQAQDGSLANRWKP